MPRKPFRPTVSGLEVRSLLSADLPPLIEYVPGPTGTTAIVELSDKSDTLAITGDALAGGLTLTYDGVAVPLAPGTRFLAVDLGGGNDTLILDADNVELVAHGGEGDDTFVVDSADASFYVLRGDAGADTFAGSDSNTFFVEEPEFFEPFDADVVGQGGLLWVYTRATNGEEDNTVRIEDGVVTVDDLGTIFYDPALTTGILVDTNDGRDLIVHDSGQVRVIAHAGDGRDTLVLRPGDSGYGEKGNDSITYA